MVRIVLLSAASAAVAAWLSQGTVAFAGPGGARIALLPLTAGAVSLAALAAGVVASLVRRGRAASPLLLLALLALPWLPGSVPAAVLLWAGRPAVALVWAALLVILVASARVPQPRLARTIGQRPALAATLLAFVIYAIAAWSVSPSLPAGDEPHYLVITQSLLYDGDLQIENNHRRGDYHAYFQGELRPDYLRRGRSGQIYSIHAPGVSALVLPAFALAGYHGVVVFLIVLSSLAAGLAWQLARRVTGRPDAAWFGWAAIVLTPTVLLNAFTVYPDTPGALVVLTGVWALIRARDERSSSATSVRPWLLHGAALALLPWLHTRFALLAGGLGALVLLELARTKNPAAKASAFLSVPAASALAWIGFFIAVYGAADPASPYRGSDLGSPSYIAGGLAGLLFDQQYGLLAYAPVLAAAVAGLVALARTPGDFRWLPAELLFIAAPYVLTVTHFAMWWGGFSSPARFALPLLPAMAIPAASAWATATRRGTRATLLGALSVTAFVSAVLVLVDGGGLAYHSRDLYAGWLQWMARACDLQRALPSFFAGVRRGEPGGLFYMAIGIWVAALTAGWLLVRALDGRAWLRTRARLATMTALTFALAGMGAASIVWRIAGVDGVTPVPAQLELLREAGRTGRFVGFDVSHLRAVASDQLPQQLVIEASAVQAPQPLREDRPFIVLPLVPAGDYGLAVITRERRGWLMLGVGRDQFSLLSQPADAFSVERPLHLPVDVRGLVVRGDEEARDVVRALRLRPRTLLTPEQKPSQEIALHAVRYDGATVYFMDERSFPEPTSFWVGGAGTSSIVLDPDAPRHAAALLLRNAPVENRIEMRSGRWSDVLTLAPGEERQVDVPLDPVRGATLITFSVASGFRPSAVDVHSRDHRFLGVWVKVRTTN